GRLRGRRGAGGGRDDGRRSGAGLARWKGRESRNQLGAHEDGGQLPEGPGRLHRGQGRAHVRGDDRRAEVRLQVEEVTRPAPPWWRAFLIGLFAVALFWRVAALARLASGPLLTQLSADADVCWRWASQIRSGGWLPVKPFFLAPLYPYWLATIRSLVGDSIARVLWVQTILGAGAVVLVADATRRIASPRAGVLVGVMLAGYGMAVAFDLLILGECLMLFLGCLALWLVIRGGRNEALWVGALIGLMGLGRPTFLLLLLPFGAYLMSQTPRRRFRSLAVMLVVP